MGAPTRPSSTITYEQMVQYEANRVKWFKFYGYITNIKELADIFGMPHVTFTARLKAGWPIEAALLADTHTQWTKNNIKYFVQYTMDTADIIQTLDKHFIPSGSSSSPKSKKTVSGKKRV